MEGGREWREGGRGEERREERRRGEREERERECVCGGIVYTSPIEYKT